MIKTILFFLVITFSTINVEGQSIGDWTAYTSLRSVSSVLEDSEGRIWSFTTGGIGIFEDTVLVKSLTTIDGLTRLDATTATYDPEGKRIFAGYLDGTIDVIDVESFEIDVLSDIRRNESFSPRTINKFEIIGNSLFVATDFGIVDYDLNTLFVKDTYSKLGSFDRGIKVNDLILMQGTLYAATQSGIATTTIDGFFAESNWENFDQNNGFVSEDVIAVGFLNGEIYASTSNSNYVYKDDNWTINNEFGNNIVIDYSAKADNLIALSIKNIFIKKDQQDIETRFLGPEIGTVIGDSRNETATILFGTLNESFGKLNESLQIEFIIPNGPYQNFFDDINFDNGILIAGSTQKSARDGNIDRGKGYYIFDSEWKSYNGDNTPELSSSGFRQVLSSTITNNYYYFGSWGRGVVRHHKETNEIIVFDETNSTLRGWSTDDPLFPVITGLETDTNGDVWIVSRFADNPLYRQTPGDDDWVSYPKNTVTSSADLYESLFIDSFNQKWIPLQSSSTAGVGLLVLNTGDVSDPDDDRGVKLENIPANGNLPDNKVKAIIQDKNGEVWIGTERGIARFLFPELIIDGGAEERRAQWLINEDTSAVSRLLLRDVNVKTMAVNSANEKWIGSENQGIWVLNEDGSRIEQRFTTDNSPLFSNSIESISINQETGEVFIATDLGLISYMDVPRSGTAEMKDLKVYPNPFSYKKNSRIIIEGLGGESEIKITGVDGTVVNSLASSAGRAEWNGLDYNGNELGTGVYFIIAIGKDDSGKGIGKVVIVR